MTGANTRNKLGRKLPKCGKHARSTGKPCRNVAGKNTDHFGIGACWLHGGDTPEIHGRWSVMRRESLRERMQSFKAKERAYLDREQDILLTRTFFLDYIERYDEVT